MEGLTRPTEQMLVSILEFLPKLVQALVVLALSLWIAGLAARALHRALSRSQADPEITLLVSRVVKIGLAGLGLVVALEQVDFDLTGFVTGLGIIGFTIGFALQDVSKNLVAGLLLLLQQPFDIGDAIEVSGYAGVVTHINLRATTMRTFDGVEVHIPNTDVYAKVVRVFGGDYYRRLDMTVLTGTSDAERAKEVALAAIVGVPGVVTHRPTPRGLVLGVEAAGSRVLVWFWVDLSATLVVDAGDAAVRQVHQALVDADLQPRGVTLASPQPDVMGGIKPKPKGQARATI